MFVPIAAMPCRASRLLQLFGPCNGSACLALGPQHSALHHDVLDVRLFAAALVGLQ